MTKTMIEQMTSDPEGMRLYQQERSILELTEMIWEIMGELDVSKSELASRLGKSRAYITKLLDGTTNMTVRTISDVLNALDRSLGFKATPRSVGFQEWEPTLTVLPWNTSGSTAGPKFKDVGQAGTDSLRNEQHPAA